MLGTERDAFPALNFIPLDLQVVEKYTSILFKPLLICIV